MGILSFLSAAGMPIASALGGLASGISSNIQSERYLQGVRETNEANKQIAKEQNIANYEQWLRESAWNRKQWEDTNAWNLAQWNRENAYNDPSQQMARLRAAGINPYAALGQVQGGLSSSVSTNPAQPSQAPPAVGATMQAPGLDAYRTGISEAIQGMMSAAQMRFVNAQAKNEELKGDTFMIDLISRLNQQNASAEASRASAQNSRASARAINWQTDFNNQVQDYLYRQVAANLANTEQSTAQMNANTSRIRQQMSLDNARFSMEQELQRFNMREGKRMNDFTIKGFFANLDLQAQRLANDVRLTDSQILVNGAQYQDLVQSATNRFFNSLNLGLDAQEKAALLPFAREYMQSKIYLNRGLAVGAISSYFKDSGRDFNFYFDSSPSGNGNKRNVPKLFPKNGFRFLPKGSPFPVPLY